MTPLLNTNAYLFLDSRADGRPRAIGEIDRMSRAAATPGGGFWAGQRVLLECGAEMAGLRQWAAKAMQRQNFHRDVRLGVMELARKRAFVVDLYGVLISSFTLPALDKSQKGPAFAKAEFVSERTRVLATSFSTDPKAAGYTGLPSIPWSASHFRLKIAGLETESAAVTKIEAATFSQTSQIEYASKTAVRNLTPVSSRWSSIRVAFAPAHLTRVRQWHEAVLLNNRTGRAKAASLEYFSARGGAPIFTLSFDMLPVTLLANGLMECLLEDVEAGA